MEVQIHSSAQFNWIRIFFKNEKRKIILDLNFLPDTWFETRNKLSLIWN